MIAWDKAKVPQQGGGERREIKRLSLPIGDTKIRLIGEVMPRYVYWITTTEGKRMPLECLRFVREQEKFIDSNEDPFKELPPDVFSDKPQFAYICNVLDRRDGQIKIFDLKSTIYRQIVDFAGNKEYGNPADPKTGYDITVKKEKTGPLPQNVKYTCLPARASTELTEEEQKADLFDLHRIFKRQTYDDQKKWMLLRYLHQLLVMSLFLKKTPRT
jgi:hypothetical protein